MTAFNACSQLVTNEDKALAAYNQLVTNGKDPFQVMLSMQHDLQVMYSQNPNLNGQIPHPDKLETCGEIMDWAQQFMTCITDEAHEFYNSLGGMSNGEKQASAIWKHWKKNNTEYRNRKFSDLSEEDQLEAKFELIDMMHFVMSMLLMLKMDSKEIFKLYYLKNAENFERQENGY